MCVAVAPFGGSAHAWPVERPYDQPDPAIIDGSAQRALDHARAQWRRSGIRSYRYEVKPVCFCRPDGWDVYIVRGNRSRYPKDTYSTVPRLLRAVQDAIDGKSNELRVTYSRRGVPRSLYAYPRSPRPDTYIADAQDGFDLRRFRRLRARAANTARG